MAGWIVLVVLVLAASLLAWRLDSHRRVLREFEVELAAREPVTDAELISRFFDTDDVAPDVPPMVRRLFADSLGYPPEKLRPEDELGRVSGDLDISDVIENLESSFGITFTEDEIERTACTIRAVSLRVASKAKLPRDSVR